MVKIDTDEMENGQVVADKLGGGGEGLPWVTILDSEGEELVNSTGPRGNVGCPVIEQERAYFIQMLEKTQQRNSADDLEALSKALESYAASL